MNRCLHILLSLTVAGAVSMVASDAHAIKYMSIGDAVKSFVPKGDTIIKVTKKLDSGQKSRLKNDYGWSPTQESYVFYAGRNGSKERTAFVFIQPEIFNTCFHKFAVGMKPNGEVIDAVIVELSCPRATPINKKTFLKQFRGKRHADALTIYSDIDAVTGATLSSEAVAQATRKAVSLHNLLFGGAEPVRVSSATKRARDTGAAKIQKAIETGETLAKEGKPGAAQLPPETR